MNTIFFYLIILIWILFYIINKILINKEYYENSKSQTNTDLSFESIMSDNIIFLDSNNLYNILVNDNDNYYKTFYNTDLHVRKIKNIDEYFIYIKKSICSLNNNEKNKIIKCINNANNKLKYINKDWFSGEKCIKIPWKIASITGKLYENGLPHTRNDIIIISKEDINKNSEKKLTNTLVHEKVHIYQKIYKNDINIYLNKYNFKKYKKRSENDNIRSNPDLDDWIYIDDNNNVYKATYNENAESIEDIKYIPYDNQSSEHPFEKMAIEIENLQ